MPPVADPTRAQQFRNLGFAFIVVTNADNGKTTVNGDSVDMDRMLTQFGADAPQTYQDGLRDGTSAGFAQGYTQGGHDARRQMILRFLQARRDRNLQGLSDQLDQESSTQSVRLDPWPDTPIRAAMVGTGPAPSSEQPPRS